MRCLASRNSDKRILAFDMAACWVGRQKSLQAVRRPRWLCIGELAMQIDVTAAFASHVV